MRPAHGVAAVAARALMDALLVPVKSSQPRIDGLPVVVAWLIDSNPDDVMVPSFAAEPELTPMPSNAGTAMHTNHRKRTNADADQPEMTTEIPLTADAATGAPRVTENALVATVMLATLVVPRFVVPLRSDTDAALPLHAALTPVKLTAVI